MTTEALYHRLGVVLEVASISERTNSAGRTKRFSRCRVSWDDNGETSFPDLSETYSAGERTAVIFKGGNYICDLNLATGRQSVIGDRVEGVAALILLISLPLCFVLVGFPLYWSVMLYSRITTARLRRQIAGYLRETFASGAIQPQPARVEPVMTSV
ncbi:MAG: hypothetical protein KGS00_02195 [Alphaproteobacteria bacterium]|nr:hypothetical protein [Alphaproteobacteria bacterium]